MNPDALNNTATGRQIDVSQAAQRIELIARIVAEILLKPIFAGILKELTDGTMEKLAFRLRDKFVEYDPNEWRDQYDMTINVGLGTGDKVAQAGQLQMILQNQMGLMGMGLTNPDHIYHTQSKIIENAGYKDVQNFLQKPDPSKPFQPPPPPQLQMKQMELQADSQKFQAQTQQEQMKFQAEMQAQMQLEQLKADAKLQEVRANLELQASNDQRDSEREVMKAQLDAQAESERLAFEKWKTEFNASLQIELKNMEASKVPQEDSSAVQAAIAQISEQLGGIANHITAPRKLVKDANGRTIGVDVGGVVKPIIRNAAGQVEGL
jgi:hypothetical protein